MREDPVLQTEKANKVVNGLCTLTQYQPPSQEQRARASVEPPRAPVVAQPSS